jgi:translation initiation factor IF-2
MSDSNDDKTTSVTGKKTFSLKRPSVEQGMVRQEMGRGRTKAVVVETRKRRINRPEDDKPVPPVTLKPRPAAAAEKPAEPAPAAKPAAGAASTPAAPSRAPAAKPAPRGAVLNQLSASEVEARRRALQDSRIRDVEERKRAEEEAARRAEEEARRAAEEAEAARIKAEEDARLAKEAAEQAIVAEEAAANAPAEAIPPTAEEAPRGRRRDAAEEEAPSRSGGAARPGGPARPGAKVTRPETPKPARPKAEEDRRRGKLTLTAALNDDGNSRGRSLSAMRRRQEKMRRSMTQEPREKIAREVTLPETITIQELSQRMAERSVDVIKYLMKEGQMMKPGDVIDADLAELIAGEFGHTVRRVSESDVELGIFNVEDEGGEMVSRPPVVTIMGHVDHGKTSLLDAIRDANVVSGEAGGITQHIGAYQVEKNGQLITFIDTPGHAAFTAMRARGAQATDIAILVVAADDAVMPQTIESINHAKAAGRADHRRDQQDRQADGADAQKVRTDLLQHEVFVESMGGEVLDVEVSATQAAQPRQAARRDPAAGRTARSQGQPRPHRRRHRDRGQARSWPRFGCHRSGSAGTLKPGEILVAGDQWGRVRALVNDRGEHVKEAGPAFPVEILGLQGTPQAGDRFAVVENESRAREITEYRQRLPATRRLRPERNTRFSRADDEQLQDTAARSFRFWSRATCRARSKPLPGAIEKLGTDEVKARIIHSGAGGITESDISLAEASGAMHHRLQRPCQQAGSRRGRARRHRDPLLQHHLRSGG